jgi:DNA-binding HxlR family transcriptional regulator
MQATLTNKCPIRTTLELVGGKWKLLLIKQLADGPARFAELGKAIPEVSEKILSAELKDLLESGMIEKEGESKPIYKLTELGKTALPLIEHIANFGIEYQKQRLG